MRRFLRPTAILFVLALAACAKKHDGFGPSPATHPVATAAAAPQKTPAVAPDHRKIIRTGSAAITITTGYDAAREKLDTLVQQMGGYIDATQVWRGENAVTTATITVRVPTDKFSEAVAQLHELGDVTTETTNAADITDQYVDLEARLASAKALEQRLLELAADKTGTIDSVLSIEKELARVQGEIDGYEGHLRQWNDQIDLSTLTLTLSTRTPEIVANTSFGGRVSHAFKESIHALDEFASWLVVTFIALLPWLLLAAPVVFVIRKLRLTKR